MKKLFSRTKASRRRLVSGAAVLMMLGATVLSAPSQRQSRAKASPERQALQVVYVSDAAELNLREEDAAKIDQINYAFALLEDGRATGDHWKGLRQMKAYLRQHPAIRGVLSVGGWGADGFSQACATEEGRTTLAQSILALMEEHGFTGVDIDWEYPGSAAAGIASSDADVENWYLLLEQLRAGLDQLEADTGKEYVLSVALGAGEEQLQSIDGGRLAALVDQAVAMTYDLLGFDKMTGHHAGLYPNANRPGTGAYAINTLIAGGFPAEKLLLGVPAYGRQWRHVPAADHGLHQRAQTAGNKWLPYADVLALEEQGFVRHYDETAQAAWWYDGSSFVSAEDERSLGYKAQWILDRQLLGAAVWSGNQDTGAVIDALHRGLRGA